MSVVSLLLFVTSSVSQLSIREAVKGSTIGSKSCFKRLGPSSSSQAVGYGLTLWQSYKWITFYIHSVQSFRNM